MSDKNKKALLVKEINPENIKNLNVIEKKEPKNLFVTKKYKNHNFTKKRGENDETSLTLEQLQKQFYILKGEIEEEFEKPLFPEEYFKDIK